MSQIWNPSTQAAEAGGLQFEASLGYLVKPLSQQNPRPQSYMLRVQSEVGTPSLDRHFLGTLVNRGELCSC